MAAIENNMWSFLISVHRITCTCEYDSCVPTPPVSFREASETDTKAQCKQISNKIEIEEKTFPYLISVGCRRHRSTTRAATEAKAYMFVFGNFVDTCNERRHSECAGIASSIAH